MDSLQATSNSISVVVPARNEEATIAEVVERSFRAFSELGREGEVLVVDDGSTDGTADMLAGLMLQHPSLRSSRLQCRYPYPRKPGNDGAQRRVSAQLQETHQELVYDS